jgi:hypothetical protein
MNDEFMHQLYEEPRAGFANALYERISQQAQPRFTSILGQRLTFRNSVILFVLLLLVAACVYAVTERGWHKVGGIWVDVERTRGETFISPETAENLKVQPEDKECLTVEGARNFLHFEMRVPTWAPEGFTFANKVCDINEFSDVAGLSWAGEGYAEIGLTATNLRWYDAGMHKYVVGPPYLFSPVAPGSYREVRVDGRPAVLVRGDWGLLGLEAKWDKKMGLHLYWVDGETMYQLSTRAKVSVADLIKMAESAR